MFTIKHIFTNGKNYHAWSATSYYVDYDPATSIDGSSSGCMNSVYHAVEGVSMVAGLPGATMPRVTMKMADGTEEIFDVCGSVYVENESGKTIDRISA